MGKVKSELNNENQKPSNGFVCILGGIFIANWYSIALYLLTGEAMTTLEIVSTLNASGNIQSAATVLLFNVFGNAFMFVGILCLVKCVFSKIKHALQIRKKSV